MKYASWTLRHSKRHTAATRFSFGKETGTNNERWKLMRDLGSRGAIMVVASFLLLAMAVSGCAPSPRRQAKLDFKRIRKEYYSKKASKEVAILDENSTLGDYIRYAELNNPGMRSAFAMWRAAMERIPQVTSLDDPIFRYTYFIDEVETRVGSQEQKFAVLQKFPFFGKLDLKGEVAVQEANRAMERFQAERLRVIFQVKKAYFEYYYLKKAIDLTGENEKLLTYFEKVAQSRYKANLTSIQDLLKAQTELGKISNDLLTLRDLRGPIVAELNAALNRPAATDIPWPKGIEPTAFALDDEEILRLAEVNSPQILELSYQIKREQEAVKLAWLGYAPDVTVGVEFIDVSSGPIRPRPRDNGEDASAVMFSINAPIWYKKLKASVDEASSRLEAAKNSKIDKINSLSSRLKLVLYQLRDAERQVALYRDALIPKAQQTLKSSETDYVGGQVDFLNLIDSQRVLLAFDLAFERAFASREQRLAEIEMLVGQELRSKPVQNEE